MSKPRASLLAAVLVGLFLVGGPISNSRSASSTVVGSILEDSFIVPAPVLTVCKEGPPACQFTSIQKAIDAAPFVPPIRTWNPPPPMPLVRIFPGVYEENLILYKSLWLQGSVPGEPERVILRGRVQDSSLPLALFVAGSLNVGIGIENLTLQGGLQVSGMVTGLIRNNLFLPEENSGISGLFLSGQLHLVISDNIIVGGNLFNEGITLQDVSFLPLPVDGTIVIASEQLPYSVVLLQNEIREVSDRPRSKPGTGISVRNANRVLLKGNQIYNNSGSGIEIRSSTLVTIRETRVERNGDGLDIRESLGIRIEAGEIRYNRGDGILLEDGVYAVEGSRIVANGGTGIVLVGGSPTFIQRYVITGNFIAENGVGLKAGVDLDRVVCRGNRIEQNRNADYMRGSEASPELRAHCEED